MPEPIDVYADRFTVTVTPFGANLSFSLVEPHPAPHKVLEASRVATIRMSIEHLKTMVVIIRNQIKQVEAQAGVKYEVPTNILTQLGIPLEDWDGFWK